MVRMRKFLIKIPESFFRMDFTFFLVTRASYASYSFSVNSVVLVSATTNNDKINTPQIQATIADTLPK
jgi:hypothetical protein